jgi:hypothetical protein
VAVLVRKLRAPRFDAGIRTGRVLDPLENLRLIEQLFAVATR